MMLNNPMATSNDNSSVVKGLIATTAESGRNATKNNHLTSVALPNDLLLNHKQTMGGITKEIRPNFCLNSMK